MSVVILGALAIRIVKESAGGVLQIFAAPRVFRLYNKGCRFAHQSLTVIVPNVSFRWHPSCLRLREMAFCLTDVKAAFFPTEAHIAGALKQFGLPESKIRAAVQKFVCQAAPDPVRGYQQEIAHDLQKHLERLLTTGRQLFASRAKYSPNLNEKSDLTISRNGCEKRIYFEIEFRPNVEKDLVKFQIGANTGSLAVAVLILAVDRNTINTRYITMPEFGKFERLIRELKPSYPLVLYGIVGGHVEE